MRLNGATIKLLDFVGDVGGEEALDERHKSEDVEKESDQEVEEEELAETVDDVSAEKGKGKLVLMWKFEVFQSSVDFKS